MPGEDQRRAGLLLAMAEQWLGAWRFAAALSWASAASLVQLSDPQRLRREWSTNLTGLVVIKKAAGVDKGSGTPHTDKVGSVTAAQVREIAQTKMPDLNANTIEAAEKIIAGTARSMGITVKD